MIDNHIKERKGPGGGSLPQRRGGFGWDLAPARETQGGRLLDGDPVIVTCAVPIRDNDQSQPPPLCGLCLAKDKCNNTVCPGGVEQLQRLHCRIHWLIAGFTATGATRCQDQPAEIVSPLVFLAPDELPQLVHGSGHAAHTLSRRALSCRLVDFAAPNTVQAQRAQFMTSSEASN